MIAGALEAGVAVLSSFFEQPKSIDVESVRARRGERSRFMSVLVSRVGGAVQLAERYLLQASGTPRKHLVLALLLRD
jgi:hypothetical protein